MQNQRRFDRFVDFFQHIETKFRQNGVIAVGIADGNRERVHTRFVAKTHGVFGIGTQNFVRFPLTLIAADYAEFRLDGCAVITRKVDNIFDGFYILFKRQLRAVKHHGSKADVQSLQHRFGA